MEDPNSIFGKGWARKSKLYNSPADFNDCVLQQKMACIESAVYITQVMADDFTKTGKCRLAVANERLARTDITYGFQKGSKIQSQMNTMILRMSETGILHRLIHNDEGNATYCNVAPGKELKPQLRAFVVQDFVGIFSILFGGWFLATLVFMVEFATKKGTSSKIHLDIPTGLTSQPNNLGELEEVFDKQGEKEEIVIKDDNLKHPTD